MISLRTMTDADIEAGNTLCRSAGWNQIDADWKIFLNASPEGCFVAVDSGTVVGTSATITYGERFAWIGMVLVDPAYKRQGIGTQLLLKALNSLEKISCVKLDATPAGREVYLKLGFVDEYKLVRMVNTSSGRYTANIGSNISLITLSDSGHISAVDLQTFGADRSKLLAHLLIRSGHLALTNVEGSAYLLTRNGFKYLHIGPVVAPNIETAKHLVITVLEKVQGAEVVLDATSHAPEWIDWLKSIGFVEQRPFIRMYKGSNNYPGLPRMQYAIMGPEFG